MATNVRSGSAPESCASCAVVTQGARWNHNIHYHPVIVEAVGAGCSNVLDVGCGEGTLARELRASVEHVVAIDTDTPSIDAARRHAAGANVEYVLGDVLRHPFERESFDAVVSVAALHHMDAVAGLERMRDLVRPSGILAIVGLARARIPADIPYLLTAAAAHRIHRLTKRPWEHPSPIVWPPPETYDDMRRIVDHVLPGARYRRHLLWRYSVIWRKPPAQTAAAGRRR